jgi:phosphoglycolate phosphatase
MMIKLLIFDLDGTLADTSQDIADAINYAMGPFGQRTYSVEETKAMVGSGISKLLESLIPPDPPVRMEGNADLKGLALGRFLEYYSNHLLDNTKAYPHVNATLSKLTGYKKAVLSNKRAAYSKEILEKLGTAQYLDIIWGSDSVREKKPSPVPILDLLTECNVSKNEAVIIGDSNYDVEAGRAAGIKIIAVTYGFRSIEYLKDADFIIDSFDELLNILPKIDHDT